MSRPSRTTATIVAGLALIAVLAPGSAAAPPPPRLRVIAAASHVDVVSYEGGVYLDLGVYLSAVDGPFEIRVARDRYVDPIAAWQVLDGGATQPVPTNLLRRWWGFKDFATIRIARDGVPIRTLALDWCPGGTSFERTDDSGPTEPTYPQICFANPFTRGAVWGIDQGWASSLATDAVVRLGEGAYTARVRIREPFRTLFQIAPEDAEAEVAMTVTNWGGGCIECSAPADATDGSGGRVRASAVPTDLDPDPATVPDLVALPAFGISIDRFRGREVLSFGADIWNAGPAPLIVEGFRREGEDLMDANQYFSQGGTPVGQAPVGGFEFDHHGGHEHWHFLQFARYRLLDDDRQAIVKSRKQAFCLAPTDAIDLLVPGAERAPGFLGFSRCGGPSSLWIRETLPVGWGDTYFQGLFGQGFDVTDLPNGTYFIEVTANPQGLLYDADDTNDTRLRKVVIWGEPGARRVWVPAWNGIDTERNR